MSSFQLPPLGDLPQPMSTLSEVSFTELDVFHVLQSLDPSKAMGCDGISEKLCSGFVPTTSSSVFPEPVSVLSAHGMVRSFDKAYL